MLSEKLKEKTKLNHQLLEKKLVGKLKAMRSKQDYTELLALFYSFFGGLELAIDQHIDTSHLPDYPQRRKTAALAHDITELGAGLPVLAGGNEIPPINNHLQALGALYVIEGSTLGGKIISKMISGQLQLSAGLSFFNGYGEQTENMWQIFKQSIDQPLEAIEEDKVILSANDTFLQFSRWFDQHA
jgi:heme oxygenase